MAKYGAVGEATMQIAGSPAPRRVVLAAVGLICFAAMLALISFSSSSSQTSMLSRASVGSRYQSVETQALAQISESDDLLSAAESQDSEDPIEALERAAKVLEEKQDVKIRKAAAKLSRLEQERKMVKKAASKLLSEAQSKMDGAQQKSLKQEEQQAEKNFEREEQKALKEAARKIQKAALAKEQVEKSIKQQLGANNDKFLDMNPPTIPPPQVDPFSNLDPPVYKKAQKSTLKIVQQHGANNDKFLDMNPPTVPQVDPFSNLDPPVYKKAQKSTLRASSTSLSGSASSAAKADSEVEKLEAELKVAKQKAARAEKNMIQHLSQTGSSQEAGYQVGKEGKDWKPTFYEDYQAGKLGPMAESKRVPEDHPAGHKKCRFHDIDCDELFPYGKASNLASQPDERNSKLGDNMVGVFGQDDVVVPTGNSGLISHASPYVDRFQKWPEDSKKNKDLLYGSARKIISQKYTGVGDVYVPLGKVEKLASEKKATGQPLADFFFGSWQQGFIKPHDKQIRSHVNMFDQPYRQHWSVATGKGHQVFKSQQPNEYGGPVSLGPTKGD